MRLTNTPVIMCRVHELDRVKAELLKDANFGRQIVDKDNQQVVARSIIRGCFSAIEAALYATKQLALAIANDLGKITVNDESKLTDTIRTKAGVSKPKYMTLTDNVLFTFDYLPRIVGSGYKLQTEGNPRWDQFSEAVTVRNRITHPKSMNDLNITRHDLILVQEAGQWWFDELESLNRSVASTLATAA